MSKRGIYRNEATAAALREILRRRRAGAMVGASRRGVSVLALSRCGSFALKETYDAPASVFGLRPVVRDVEATLAT